MMPAETITNGEIWQFIQDHKKKTKDKFGSWLLGQHYRTTSKIIQAVVEYNRVRGG